MAAVLAGTAIGQHLPEAEFNAVLELLLAWLPKLPGE